MKGQAKPQLNVRQGTWQMELDQLKGFLLRPGACFDFQKSTCCLRMLLHNLDEKEDASFQETCREVMGAPLSNIGRCTFTCQHKTNWRIPGRKQLSASCQYLCSYSWSKSLHTKVGKNQWCSLLYSPRNLKIILFNDSMFPDGCWS